MDCPELEEMLKSVKGDNLPLTLREPIETHLAQCHACRAGMNNFLKISQILSKTVYGSPAQDQNLTYLSQVVGRRLHWQTEQEQLQASQENRSRRLLRIFIWIVVAAGVGASGALILGRSGFIGGHGPAQQVSPDSGRPAGPPLAQDESPQPVELSQAPEEPSPGPPASSEPAAPSDSALNPDAVYDYLNSRSELPAPPAPAPRSGMADSTRLKELEAELDALQDAVSRTPRDRDLRNRAMGKYREVIDERKKLGRSSGVKEYYNLGYLHYLNGEYPQTAIVTSEGLRLVRIGPTQYLHYLKAMAHYQMARKASTPLPPDSSSNENARVRGETMRAELDLEGRKKAIIEYRRAINEFSYLLNIPELESAAREWVLKCNEQIGKVSTEP